MHSFTLVLLPPPFDDLRARAEALLAPHVLDEDNYDDDWRTDYWTIGEGQIRDEETERELGIAADDYVHQNVCLVRNLVFGEVTPSVVVTPDGTWHDLFDFGWRFMTRDTPESREASERWKAHLRKILEAHMHCVAIELDTHS